MGVFRSCWLKPWMKAPPKLTHTIRRPKCLIWILLLLLCTSHLSINPRPTEGPSEPSQPDAEGTQALNGYTAVLPLIPSIEYLKDPGGRLNIEDLERPDIATRFQPWTSPSALNFGFTQDTYWLRLPLRRSENAPKNWLLEVAYAPITELDFYAPGQAPVLTGSSRPLNTRPFFDRHFVFPVHLSTDQTTVYLRVRSSFSVTLPIKLWEQTTFQHYNAKVLLVQFLYFGAHIALFIYNGFLFLSLRDRRFLLFCTYVLTFSMAMFAGNGFGRLFIWPEWHAFDEVAQVVFLSIAASAVLALTRLFLRPQTFSNRLDFLLHFEQWLSIVLAMGLIGSLISGYAIGWINQFFAINAIAISFLVLYASLRAYRSGLNGARYFLWAWYVLCIGGLIAALRAFDWAPTNLLTAYALQIASAGEMLLLAMALADSVRRERDSREAAQNSALDSSARTLQLLKTSEERLELAVLDRTLQLQEALQQQQKTLEQYIRFGSLISHECRNPLGVIESQISLMNKEMGRGINQQEKRLGIVMRATRRLTGVFDKWLQSDRLDSALEELNLHRIFIRTWMNKLLEEQAHVADDHPIRLSLDHRIETLEADEGLLDIAVVNLLDNAAKYSPQHSAIELRTQCRGQWIGISVQDHGRGIDAAEHGKVFDEFYRSEPESGVRGMGLGLAMVRRIALAHGGWVELESAPGKGACFTIWLPASPGD